MDISTLENERRRAIQQQGDLRMGVSGGWNVAKGNMRSSPYADFEPYDEEDEWGFGWEEDGQGFFTPIPRIPFDERVEAQPNDMMIAGAQDIDTKMHILPSGMMVDENQIKYMWSPREQKFIDMGPYDPYYDGLPIPLGQRNTDMKIAKLPHTPPTEKMLVGNRFMDSPLRFKSEEQRAQELEDYSKNFIYRGN